MCLLPGGRAGRWWLSKVSLSPADGPYLVIVEQPKQVSKQKGGCGMASALGTNGVVVAGRPWRSHCPRRPQGIGWSLLLIRCCSCGSEQILPGTVVTAGRCGLP